VALGAQSLDLRKSRELVRQVVVDRRVNRVDRPERAVADVMPGQHVSGLDLTAKGDRSKAVDDVRPAAVRSGQVGFRTKDDPGRGGPVREPSLE
jgi:hypothetical protein